MRLQRPSPAPQVLGELKHVMGYIERENGIKPNYLGLGLSSRRNLCIHERVGRARGAQRPCANSRRR